MNQDIAHTIHTIEQLIKQGTSLRKQYLTATIIFDVLLPLFYLVLSLLVAYITSSQTAAIACLTILCIMYGFTMYLLGFNCVVRLVDVSRQIKRMRRDVEILKGVGND